MPGSLNSLICQDLVRFRGLGLQSLVQKLGVLRIQMCVRRERLEVRDS